MFPLSAADEASLTAFLQELVRIPSPSGQEGAVAERLAAEMKAAGLEDVHTDKAGSVVGRLGTGQRPILVYNGHMDNVGPGNRNAWRHDPFGAVIEDGVLYGRGACDMKGALAAMVYSARLLIREQVPLKGTLYIVGVVQEETCEGLAMRLLMENEGLQPDFVVLGEPSSLQVSRGHKGRMIIRLTTRGRAAHGSAPERGENAIYKMARLALGIAELNQRLPLDPFLGKGSISLNVIAGGSEINVIPDMCTAYLDRRLTLGENEENAVREIALLAAREGIQAEVEVPDFSAQSYNGYTLRARRVFNAWTIAEDHPLVQATLMAAEEVLGHRPGITRWAFSTDGAYTAGVAGIPTVGFGPGEERFAHVVDEQIRLSDVFVAARVYARLAQRILG